jgi:hypothetical protein
MSGATVGEYPSFVLTVVGIEVGNLRILPEFSGQYREREKNSNTEDLT